MLRGCLRRAPALGGRFTTSRRFKAEMAGEAVKAAVEDEEKLLAMQIALERQWQMEDGGVDVAKDRSKVEDEEDRLVAEFEKEYVRHLRKMLEYDPKLNECLNFATKRLLDGLEPTEEEILADQQLLTELRNEELLSNYDEEEESHWSSTELTDDHVLVSLNPVRVRQFIQITLRSIANGLLVGKASVNRSKRASIVHDTTGRTRFQMKIPRTFDIRTDEVSMAAFYTMYDTTSNPHLFLGAIDGSIRNIAGTDAGWIAINEALDELYTGDKEAAIEAVKGGKGAMYSKAMCAADILNTEYAKVFKKKRDRISPADAKKIIKNVSDEVKEKVEEALASRNLGDDHYTSLISLLKRVSNICLAAENENKFILAKNKKAMKAVQPRHFHAAASLLSILLNVEYKGTKPFVITSTIIIRAQRRIKTNVLRADAIIESCLSRHSAFVSDYPPMLCPPEPWETNHIHDGSYIKSPYKTLKAEMLRISAQAKILGRRMLRAMDLAMPSQKVTHSLNYINNVRWRLNEKAIDHVQFVKAKGLDMGDKLRGGWVPLPPPPPKYHTEKSEKVVEQAKEAQAIKITQRSSAQASAGSITGLMEKFRGQTLYLPSNCDFRGRTYPLHSGLNYQASDFIRSLLEFADAKPMGPTGIFHLKIHAANLMGLDKASFNDRVQWCDDNIEAIVRSAENPKAEDALWREADKPLLGHVVLCELAAAYKCSQGPENYVTRVPIHVDGSCNGLQHYSAIALDEKGAATANLTRKSHSDKPSDVYTTVLEQVKVYNQANMSTEHAAMATFVHPLLKRKTVKQSVMTNVYGVTQRGMRDQVVGQLIAQTEDMVPRPTPQFLMNVSSYVVTLIEKSLEDVFQGAIQVQKWFKELLTVLEQAHLGCGWMSPPITFVSPAGVPVLQPYFNESAQACTVNVGGFSTAVEFRQTDYRIASRKNKTAFPPNFIHSMDASHVHTTTCKLKEAGIFQFGSVHDSYWGHPADMDVLNHILREAFVEMYATDRLEELYADFQSSYGKVFQRANLTLPLPPKRGNFEITEVLDSPYFFA